MYTILAVEALPPTVKDILKRRSADLLVTRALDVERGIKKWPESPLVHVETCYYDNTYECTLHNNGGA